ncbi:MAG: fatty acid metabolism transcriptional regulator FadR [Desulfocucumaceae bacterium]
MKEINKSERSSDLVENKLIRAVMDGVYAPGSYLPPERDLALSLGVARPTLREALGRLGRDGWFTVRKGQPTQVNDFWSKGNLNTLANIAQNTDRFPQEFVIHLLEVRAALAPAFTRSAVSGNPARVVAVLAESGELEDSSEAFAQFDWQLQKALSILSGNPVYLLILNSFDVVYVQLARQYFSRRENRQASQKFYRRLLTSAMAANPGEAERFTREAMEESIELWKNRPVEEATTA